MSFRSIILFYIQYLISQNDDLCLQVTYEFPKIYHYHYTIHVYVVIHLCVCVWSFWVNENMCKLYISVFCWRSNYQEPHVVHVLCACLYLLLHISFMFNDLWWEVFFFLVDTWYWFNGWLIMLKRFFFVFFFIISTII